MYTCSLTYGRGSGFIGGDATEEKARETLAYHVRYYQEECGYTDVRDLSLVEHCPVCQGNGRIKRVYKTRRVPRYDDCRVCKGSGIARVLDV